MTFFLLLICSYAINFVVGIIVRSTNPMHICLDFCGCSLERALSREKILAGDEEHIARVSETMVNMIKI